MKLDQVKDAMKVEIVSLTHTNVGESCFAVGDVLTVEGKTRYSSKHTLRVLDVNGKQWCINHVDIEPVIEYTHPMQEHLGKEVYVAGKGKRGFVVSYSNIADDDDLLVDFGDEYFGHRGDLWAAHPQKNRTNSWVNLEDITFLTEDEE